MLHVSIDDLLRSRFGDGGGHGGKGHFGKEVCGAVERGGTRAFASADPQRKEPGEARLLKARILLKADVSEAGEGWSDSWIIQAFPRSTGYASNWWKRASEAVLSRKRRMTPPVAAIFDGEKEAKLIALACSKAAEGARPLDVAPAGEQGRGTRHCRARKPLNDRTHTQKNCLKPHRRQCWVIPPKANSAFVAAMEDVLAVYTRPHNADYPLVCLDETSKQLIAETRTPHISGFSGNSSVMTLKRAR